MKQNNSFNTNSETISRINALKNDRKDLNEMLSMSNEILTMGGDSEMNLQNQSKLLESTRKKQNKYIDLIPEINQLIRKIE
mmetsp:Transcript_28809/g.32923  ORF Transcript_28809/g.32923 Transcript_28809/m.32923 type:complete len:81 (+) Transcript_28809:413-655(+)|eukprot:CAMPEP_0168326778 /NCGR_PEP_ID=MMETSP0213-20121227/5511_1 /TAXON_ID=151035 /ORGANISM="Euplotes harpa, Strain FSP1.4" /LENGTH=80 /DNA_ID=CAMNT_0008329569 /DNA_START=407 /DNA_END=649 /DNA_ORIENTATION=+